MIEEMAQIETSPPLTPSEPLGFPDSATPAFSPLYQQIKGLMLQSLQGGEWKPGEAIPSEMDLAARFRVSQGTMRKAIDELAAENPKLLNLRTGDPVLQAQRVLSFAGVPTILEDIWLPGGPFKGLTAERLAQYHGPMYALFETEFGVRMVRATENIRAVQPDAVQCEQLKITPNTPLLSVERIAYTYKDLPMELRRGYYRTETHHYRNELN